MSGWLLYQHRLHVWLETGHLTDMRMLFLWPDPCDGHNKLHHTAASSIWINTPTPLGTRTQWWNFNLAAGCISNSTGHKIIFQIGNQQWVELRYQKNMNMFHQINVVTEWMWTNSVKYLHWSRPLHYYNVFSMPVLFIQNPIYAYWNRPIKLLQQVFNLYNLRAMANIFALQQ